MSDFSLSDVTLWTQKISDDSSDSFLTTRRYMVVILNDFSVHLKYLKESTLVIRTLANDMFDPSSCQQFCIDYSKLNTIR